MFWDGVPICEDQTTYKFDFYAFINEIAEEENLFSSVDNCEEKSTLATPVIINSSAGLWPIAESVEELREEPAHSATTKERKILKTVHSKRTSTGYAPWS